MPTIEEAMESFQAYVKTLAGDEKGEAHVFCDRLFQAFGHAGYKEAGATLEERVRVGGKRTKFADLIWRPRVLLEMKKRGEPLARHQPQAYEYWHYMTGGRPRYVLLCNFDEILIYDFQEGQFDEPVDRVLVEELSRRYTALGFLFPTERRPLFGNDRTEVTKEAAEKIGDVFRSLVEQGETRERAQRFILQCVVALFAEDMSLLPRGLFTGLIGDCRSGAGSSYDLFGDLFRQMDTKAPARGGRYRDVRYFNGGLFRTVDPIELSQSDLGLLENAANEDWSRVNPAIFGTLFQSSLAAEERHRQGPTSPARPTSRRSSCPRSWSRCARGSRRRGPSRSPGPARAPHLDPRPRPRLRQRQLPLRRLPRARAPRDRAPRDGHRALPRPGAPEPRRPLPRLDPPVLRHRPRPFAVELAKVTMLFAKKLALDEVKARMATLQGDLPLELDSPLPLDDLDGNIRCDDALFCDWPHVDVIVGNPPYQSKNKMQQELGAPYVSRLRERYPEIPGRADYCVYWFRRAHDELPPGGSAGLVGTNTIRQNYSREGGLDYIVANGGTITEAVSTQVWSGDAVVHVSIVNWVKEGENRPDGEAPEKRKLFTQLGDRPDSPFRVDELDVIPSSLSAGTDVTAARTLEVNSRSAGCFQGQTPGHEGFLLGPEEAQEVLLEQPAARDVLHPFLTGDDLLTAGLPARWVIDFHPRDVLAARRYSRPFARVERAVLPDRQRAADEEKTRNAEVLSAKPAAHVNLHHRNFLERWWLLSYPRPELIRRLATIPRYVACSRVTKRPIFEFVSSAVRPSDVVMVFPFPDDYSFGILQSGFHWAWFMARCSTLTARFRYTSDSVFDAFPWPQEPALAAIRLVADAAVTLRTARKAMLRQHGMSLRELYASLEQPGKHPLRSLQSALDDAVRVAYGFASGADPLAALLALNGEVAAREAGGEPVTGPGLPAAVVDAEAFVTGDAVADRSPGRLGPA